MNTDCGPPWSTTSEIRIVSPDGRWANVMRPWLRGPVRRTGKGYVLHLGADERAMVERLLEELADLLRDDQVASPGAEEPEESARRQLLGRLFPPAHSDDPELEAEYQRLMRSELVESRLGAIDTVQALLRDGDPLDDAAMTALMQSLNSVRLVLGTMLEVSDDPDQPEMTPGVQETAEAQLYHYLSWLLEWCVTAMSPGP